MGNLVRYKTHKHARYYAVLQDMKTRKLEFFLALNIRVYTLFGIVAEKRYLKSLRVAEIFKFQK